MGLKGTPKLENRIIDMKPGESGYTVPWALAFDLEETPYLNLDYSIHKNPGGTVQMRVERTGSGKSDYNVDISNAGYFKWSVEEAPFSGVVGKRDDLIARLTWDESEMDATLTKLFKDVKE